jgi:hypothetical protein
MQKYWSGMRGYWVALVVGLSLALTCGVALKGSHAEANNLKGDYVEARTASVFAGACHYNGELTTTGRDALMSWNITSGSWDGISLAGMRVLAIVSAEANLADSQASRRSELIIDSSATDAQAAVLVKAVESAYAASLGQVVEVRRAPVGFKREGKTYTVSAPGAAEINVEAMPNDLCCRMPHMVWYAPLVPLDGRKVGYTRRAAYAGGPVGEAWQRAGENSAFYGSFSL